MKFWILTFIILILLKNLNCQEEKKYKDFNLINTFKIPYPAFTQGFIYNKTTKLITESTGLVGQSLIRTYALNEFSNKANISTTKFTNPTNQFGEGLAYLNGFYYQLTWMNNIINILDDNFKLVKTQKLPHQMRKTGWGLSTDGEYLYANSGTDEIFKINPSNLEVVKILKAKGADGRPLRYLNECEIVGPHMY